MPNHYFEFNKFRVEQDQCAMKVCTDACLFGAWTAAKFNELDIAPTSILDIGAGTGLLSLMLAQESSAHIDAIEMETGAAMQAVANCKASPWKDRIKLMHIALQDFKKTEPLYDLIISNPPFYEQDLKSPDNNKNIAHHSEALTLKELIDSVDQLLTLKGHFALLLPFERKAPFLAMAEKKGFYLHQSTDVHQTEKHSPFRTMLLLSRTQATIKTDSIVIKINKEYSPEFRILLTPYYLPF
ncbi:MAG: methyltransferase domain-containing protein [Sphingobacteriia bacterium]|nr:MAG: methyltransferase domain-containing protein [Sphingobacteriia bacterium]